MCGIAVFVPPSPRPLRPLPTGTDKKKRASNFGFSVLDVISFLNKKTPEDVYAGCVGVRKNYRFVEWQWKVE